MKSPVLSWLGRAFFAGLLAFVLLCLFCALYFNIPVHFENPTGATEYRYEPGRFYSRGTEGFGAGRVNNEGFNNLRDYTPGEEIDLLLMGSSHTEGFCIFQVDNAANLLNEFFAGEKYTYNIGMAGHTFLYAVKRLDKALETYRPRDAVIFELATLSYDPAAMDAAAEGTLPDIPSHSGGLLTALQKLPYLRLLYTKYFKGTNEAVAAAAVSAEPVTQEAYEAALSRLLEKTGEVCTAHGVKGILVYTPTVQPDAAGHGVTDARPGEREAFARLCAENGLVFLDLTEENIAAMEEDGALPFGFANTAPGEGHINSLGHRIFAESVYAHLTGEGA
ncbi:MAG: hypothetical protein IJT29_01110 [Oscillospiraceae bacterium]|nr:hypothetical protein [Oscillospiraceae bacterium]